MYALDLIAVRPSGERLLVGTQLNPFAQSATVYALLPAGAAEKELGETLAELARRNGGAAPILGARAPTYVIVPPGGPAPTDMAREFLLSLLTAAQVADVGGDARRLEAYVGRPWDRATKEVGDGLANLLRKPSDAGGGRKATRAELEYWWRVASSPEQVRGETSRMQAAWQGALRHAGGR